jgi:beta-phosphoglucomutase family hydrolase
MDAVSGPSSPAHEAMSRRAWLFDLDGVLTPTADLHRAAWKQMFDEELERRGLAPPFSDADYLAYVDGKHRQDGVLDFLASRGVELPVGSPGDAPDAGTIWALGNRKNELFAELLTRHGIAPYPGSKRLLDRLADREVPMAVVSSSRNAAAVLAAAGLSDCFAARVDGLTAAELGLAGKPAPDSFLHAAAELGVDPADAVVVEDALSGVEAGRAGGFGVVIGVDRGAGREALVEHGADVVVADLAEMLA